VQRRAWPLQLHYVRARPACELELVHARIAWQISGSGPGMSRNPTAKIHISIALHSSKAGYDDRENSTASRRIQVNTEQVRDLSELLSLHALGYCTAFGLLPNQGSFSQSVLP
jgi:hypothetical protein